jgi:hypothetical protein
MPLAPHSRMAVLQRVRCRRCAKRYRSPERQCAAAGHLDALADYPARLVGGQEHCHSCNVLRRAERAKRRIRRALRADAARRMQTFGLDAARCDCVHSRVAQQRSITRTYGDPCSLSLRRLPRWLMHKTLVGTGCRLNLAATDLEGNRWPWVSGKMRAFSPRRERSRFSEGINSIPAEEKFDSADVSEPAHRRTSARFSRPLSSPRSARATRFRRTARRTPRISQVRRLTSDRYCGQGTDSSRPLIS